jgi:hypothetical protein
VSRTPQDPEQTFLHPYPEHKCQSLIPNPPGKFPPFHAILQDDIDRLLELGASEELTFVVKALLLTSFAITLNVFFFSSTEDELGFLSVLHIDWESEILPSHRWNYFVVMFHPTVCEFESPQMITARKLEEHCRRPAPGSPKDVPHIHVSSVDDVLHWLAGIGPRPGAV